MLEGFIVIRIHDEDDESLIHTVVQEDKFQIQLVRSGKQELEGEISFEEIRNMAVKLDFHTFPELLQLQIKILTTTSLNDINFYYDADANKLTWKRGKNVKIVYGSVDLQERPGIREEILKSSFSRIDNLQKLEDLHAQKLDDFYAKQSLFQKEFDRLVQRERNIQSELYTKFAVVLNTKKQKIAELKSLIFDRDGEEVQSSASQPRAVEDEPPQPTTSKLPKRQLSTTDSETNSPVPFTDIPKRKKWVDVSSQARSSPTPPGEAGMSKRQEQPGANEKADDEDAAYEVDTQKLFDQMS